MRRSRLLASVLIAAAAAAIALSLPDPAAACTVCFGDPQSAETRGLRGAILFLLVLVGLVQVGFVRLFWEFRRRSKAIDDRKKQLRVLRGGVRS
jgi:hypothetical protein